MERSEGQKILVYSLLVFAVPPVVWLFFIWFLKFLNPFEFSQLLLSPRMYLLLIFSLGVVYYSISYFTGKIDDGLSKSDTKSLVSTQKTISYLVSFFIWVVPLYYLLISFFSIFTLVELTSFKFFMSTALGLFLDIIIGISFLLRIIIILEKWTVHIPPSDHYKELNLSGKIYLFLFPNIVLPIFIMFIVAIGLNSVFQATDSIGSELVYKIALKSIIVAVFLVGVIVSNIFIFKRQIVEPVRKIKGHMENLLIDSQNVGGRIEPETRDEFAYIANAYNEHMDVVAAMIRQIQDTSGNVKNNIDKLSLSSKRYLFNIQKENDLLKGVDKNIDNINETMQYLCGETGKLSSSIISMQQRISEIIGTGDQSVLEFSSESEKIVKTTNIANVGEKSMSNMRHSMEVITGVFDDITDVMTFITYTSEKINLLSLNASIEAARAGEAGAGFSIVAKQIAKLAEDTKKSSAEIYALLETSRQVLGTGSDNIVKGADTIMKLLGGVEEVERIFGKMVADYRNEQERLHDLNNNIKTVKDVSVEVDRIGKIARDRLMAIIGTVHEVTRYNKMNVEASNEFNNNTVASTNVSDLMRQKASQFKFEKTTATIDSTNLKKKSLNRKSNDKKQKSA